MPGTIAMGFKTMQKQGRGQLREGKLAIPDPIPLRNSIS